MSPTTRRNAILAGAGAALALLVIVLWEGDVGEELLDASQWVRGALHTFGAAGALAFLYVEESGVPLPVPGDVYVVYLGSTATAGALGWVAAWVGVVAVVVAGSSNLYLLSRRWGRELLEHRLARFLHLDPERLERAEGWLRRWGALTIIFGRHIPGFRIPITVLAGVAEVPYRVFAPSVALSAAIWAGAWLYLGHRYGLSVVHALSGRRALYLVGIGLLAIAVAVVVARAVAASRESEPDPA